MFSSLAAVVFARFSTPKLEKDSWQEVDAELKEKLAPYHHHLSKLRNPADIACLGDQINKVIVEFLASKPEIFEN